MAVHPIYLFALLGVGFGWSRAIVTGKEALFLAMLLPLGLFWMQLFP